MVQTETTVETERALFAEACTKRSCPEDIDFYDHDAKEIKILQRSAPMAETNQNLFDSLYTMLIVSSVVYLFAAIREVTRKQEEIYDKGWGVWPVSFFTRKKVEITIREPQLVITQGHKGGIGEFGASRNLKRIITLADLGKFINLNLELFDMIPDVEINTEKGDIMNTLDLIEKAGKIDGDLREFDDKFADTQLVYGILVNHTEKRVTVVFRGSVGGGQDWSTNLQASLTTMETPAKLSELGFSAELKLHTGFKAYLVDETPAGDKEERKYARIIQNLTDIFSEFPSYSLFITGHSLGGALASLLAFKIAATGDLPSVERPIKALTFAAPMVGPDVFQDAYQLLEKNNLLRHLRMSNQGDVVPVVPPFPYNEPFNGYTQNGVNIHLMSWGRAPQFGYRNLKSFASQSSFTPVTNHTLKQYLRRMLQRSDDFKDKTLAGMFDTSITRGFQS